MKRFLVFTLLTLLSTALMAQVEVTGARLWPGADTSRFVLDLGSHPDYRLFTLDNPPRVVIDLSDATEQGAFDGLDLQRGPIKRIRSARRKGGDLRVVLDLRAAYAPSHFTLGPKGRFGHRLVVDLKGKTPLREQVSPTLAQAPRPAAAPTAKTYQVTEQVTRVALPSQARSGLGQVRVVDGGGVGQVSSPAPAPAKVAKAPSQTVPAPPQAVQRTPTPTSNTAASSTPPVRDRHVVIAIDAGHGGHDPGAVGPKGIKEKDVVFAIAKELRALIDREPGMRAVMIRSGDYFIPLGERASRARAQQADLFLSIHANSIEQGRARGASVYTLSPNGASSEHAKLMAAKENAADLIGGVTLDDKDDLLASVLLDLSQTATIQTSAQIANVILQNLKSVGRLHSRHVEQAGFRVLKSPDMPSILVETAFISDPEEARKLASRKFQSKMAQAILRGVRDHFVMNPPAGTMLASRDKQSHVISSGETLSHIAARYRVNLDQLRSVNRIKDDRVNVGDVLTIPTRSDS